MHCYVQIAFRKKGRKQLVTASKMSDVAKLKGQGNAAELCVLIEKNGQYDRHADVMEAAAQAVLPRCRNCRPGDRWN